MSSLKKLALTAAAVAVVAYRMKAGKNASVAAKARTPQPKPALKPEPTLESGPKQESQQGPVSASEPGATKVKTKSKSKARRAKAKARAAKHAA